MKRGRLAGAFVATCLALAACGGSNAAGGASDARGDASAAADASDEDSAIGADSPSLDAPGGDAEADDAETGATDAASGDAGDDAGTSTRGFPPTGDWVSFYGSDANVDVAKVASAFRVINIDADPTDDGVGNFTDAEIQTLRAGGANRVLSYLDVGSCESFRTYWDVAPPGHASCVSSGALTSVYDGYPDEKWADLSNAAYRDLLVGWVAPRLWARGVDGFFLDNLEVVEHGTATTNGPCDAACSQGGLDLVWELRQAFPGALVVMQNATSATTRLGTTHGVPYPSLLDGISHEEVYGTGDATARDELLAWKAMGLVVAGRPFWIATEDYVGACDAASKPSATALLSQSAADGFHGYVTDASGSQLAPCFWSDFP